MPHRTRKQGRRKHANNVDPRPRSLRQRQEARFVADLVGKNQIETEETRRRVKEQLDLARSEEDCRRRYQFHQEQLRRLEQATRQVEARLEEIKAGVDRTQDRIAEKKTKDGCGRLSVKRDRRHSTETASTMSLRIDFDAPLRGKPESDRMLQMTNGHPINGFVRKINQGLNELSQTVRNTPGFATKNAQEISKVIQTMTQGLVADARPVVESAVKAQLDAEEMRRATEKWAKQLEKANEAIAVCRNHAFTFADLLTAFPDIESQVKHMKMLPDSSPNKSQMAFALLARIERLIHVHHDSLKEINGHLQVAFEDMAQQTEAEQGDDPFNAGTPSTRTRASSIGSQSFHTSRSGYVTPTRRTGRDSEGWSVPRGDRSTQSAMSRLNMEDDMVRSRDQSVHSTFSLRSAHSVNNIRSQISQPIRVMEWIESQSTVSGSDELETAQSVSEESNGGEMMPITEPSAQVPITPSHRAHNAPSARTWRGPGYSLNPESPENPFNIDHRVWGMYSPYREDNHPSRGPRNNFATRAAFGSPSIRTENWYMTRNGNMNNNNNGNNNGQAMTLSRPHPDAPNGENKIRWIESVRDDFLALYATMRAFVEESYSSPHPGILNPQYMRGSTLWPHIVAAYEPLTEAEARSYINIHMFDSTVAAVQTRRCVVGRVLFDYVYERMWDISAWKGHNPVCTRQAVEIGRDFDECDNTAASFGPITARQAALVRRIMTANNYATFREDKLSKFRSEIREVFAPLRSPMANEHMFTQDLNRLTEQAWRLGEKMKASGVGFHFFFPQIGSRFYTNMMTPIWPQNEDPTEVQARSARISLVITPVVTARDDRDHNCVVHSVVHADVVCMP